MRVENFGFLLGIIWVFSLEFLKLLDHHDLFASMTALENDGDLLNS